MSYNPETNKWVYDYKRPYNPGWSWTRNRRKYQRKMNKAMRLMNQNIENDSLWRGRFYVRSRKTLFYQYEDKSGYGMICELLFVDKKTGRVVSDYASVNEWCYFGGSRLARRMNEFITEDCKVWEEIPDPREDVTDYRRV